MIGDRACQSSHISLCQTSFRWECKRLGVPAVLWTIMGHPKVTVIGQPNPIPRQEYKSRKDLWTSIGDLRIDHVPLDITNKACVMKFLLPVPELHVRMERGGGSVFLYHTSAYLHVKASPRKKNFINYYYYYYYIFNQVTFTKPNKQTNKRLTSSMWQPARSRHEGRSCSHRWVGMKANVAATNE